MCYHFIHKHTLIYKLYASINLCCFFSYIEVVHVGSLCKAYAYVAVTGRLNEDTKTTRSIYCYDRIATLKRNKSNEMSTKKTS